MLFSVVAFKLLTPLTIPFTWDPTLRANPLSPYHSTIPLGVTIPLLLISCALSITTPFIIRGCSSSGSGNRQALGTTRMKSNPLWAELAYLLITLGQIFLALNYVYTTDFSSILRLGSSGSPDSPNPTTATVASTRSTDATFLDQTSLNWISILYGTLQILHSFYAITSGRVRATKRNRMRGELELLPDDLEEGRQVEMVDGQAWRESVRRRSREVFVEVDLDQERLPTSELCHLKKINRLAHLNT